MLSDVIRLISSTIITAAASQIKNNSVTNCYIKVTISTDNLNTILVCKILRGASRNAPAAINFGYFDQKSICKGFVLNRTDEIALFAKFFLT